MSKYRSGLLLSLLLLLAPLSIAWSQETPQPLGYQPSSPSSLVPSIPSLEEQIQELQRQIAQKNLLLGKWLDWYGRLTPESKAFLIQVQEFQAEVQSWKDSYQKERNSRDSLEKASANQIEQRNRVIKEKDAKLEDLQTRFNIVCGIGIAATSLLIVDLALRK